MCDILNGDLASGVIKIERTLVAKTIEPLVSSPHRNTNPHSYYNTAGPGAYNETFIGRTTTPV
jgi:hypothetical protein